MYRFYIGFLALLFVYDSSFANRPDNYSELREVLVQWGQENKSPFEITLELLNYQYSDLFLRQNPELGALYHRVLAHKFIELALFDEALDHIQKVNECQKQLSDYTPIEFYGLLAKRAYSSKDYEKAFTYFKKIKSWYKEHPQYEYNSRGLINALAIAHLDNKDFEKAKQYFHEVFQLLQPETTPRMIHASIRDNLAVIAFHQKQFQKSIQLLKEKEKILMQLRELDTLRLIETYTDIAEAYLQIPMPDSVKKYLDLGYSFINKMDERVFEHYLRHINLEESYVESFENSDEQIAIQKKQSQFLKDYSTYQKVQIGQRTEVYQNYLSYSLANAEALNRDIIARQAQQNESQQTILRMTIAIALLILLLITIGVYFYRQYKIRKEQMLQATIQKKTADNKRISNDLDQTIKGSQNIFIDNINRKKWTSETLSRVEEIHGAPMEKKGELVQSLHLDLLHQEDIQNKLNLQQQANQKISKQFLDQLVVDFPMLNTRDLEFCSYVKLGMSIKEIAAVRRISVGAVRKARMRLWKKMGLESVYALEEVLK